MIRPLAALLLWPLLGGVAQAAEIALYPSGPAEDSAFIRFINATAAPLEVVAREGQKPLRLEAEQPSAFFAVQAKGAVEGTLVSGGQRLAMAQAVEPGEFATVVALAKADGTLRQVAVREAPDDFNALKASLAFFSLDAGCAEASLRPAGRTADLFKAVPDGTLQRRSINPVKLSVQLVCGQTNVGAPLDLGELKAGERYSVLLLPSANGPRLLAATDTLSH